ncbi:MAG: hypothetical protein CME33_07950 [Gimesia sp.]|nr:hypothetical protein [Gimesia sp.]
MCGYSGRLTAFFKISLHKILLVFATYYNKKIHLLKGTAIPLIQCYKSMRLLNKENKGIIMHRKHSFINALVKTGWAYF